VFTAVSCFLFSFPGCGGPTAKEIDVPEVNPYQITPEQQQAIDNASIGGQASQPEPAN